MNNKTQFFILSMIIIIFTMTIIIALLTIPTELTKTGLKSQTYNLDELNYLFSDFNSIIKTLYSEWSPLSKHLTTFYLKDSSENNIENNQIITKVNVTSNFNENTLYLFSEDNKEINFNYVKNNLDQVIISFKDKLLNTNKKYKLFYELNTEQQSVKEFENKTSYYIDSTYVVFESENYRAKIRKSDGTLTEITILATGDNLINSVETKVNTTSQSSMIATTNVEFENNILKVTCSGEIFPNVVLTQEYSLSSDLILVSQNVQIINEGDYNISLIINSTLNDLAYEDYVNRTILTGETDLGEYFVLFNGKNNLLITQLKDYNQNIISSNEYELKYKNTTFSAGTFTSQTLIVPNYLNYTNAVATGKNYEFNPKYSIKESKTEYLKKLFLPFNDRIEKSNRIMSYQIKTEEVDNGIFAVTSKNPFSLPFELNIPVPEEKDLNTLVVTTKDNITIPFGLSTKNNNLFTELPFNFSNNVNQGVNCTQFKMMNLDRDEFNISIDYVAPSTSDSNSILLTYPNQTTFLLDTITNTGEKNITVETYNQTGIYYLQICNNDENHDNMSFKINTTLPLINVISPFILNSEKDDKLFFQANETINLTLTNLTQNINYNISDNYNILNNNDSANTIIINNTYNDLGDYYIDLDSDKTLINLNYPIGIKSNYLSKDNDIFLTIKTNLFKTNFFNLNFLNATNVKTDYATILSYENFELQNNFVFNLTNKSFMINNEIGTLNFSINNFEKIIDQTPLFNNFLFKLDETELEVSFFNDSNLMKVVPKYFEDNYNFKINFTVGDFNEITSNLLNGVTELNLSYISFNSTQFNEINYLSKYSDDLIISLIFFDKDLIKGDNVLRVNENNFEMNLTNKSNTEIYLYIGENNFSIKKIINQLKFPPKEIGKYYVMDYYFESNTLQSSGKLLG